MEIIHLIKMEKHTLEAVDKAGNTYSTEFEITNIYYECDAGLETSNI